MAAGEERILVSVRLRPVNAREAERGDGSDWECAGPTTLMFRGNIPERAMFPATYTYDRVFNPECSTRQVYEEGAKQVALSVLTGINSSIFAYGQTSSGKTYTMVGITEHSMSDIYDYIDKHPEREFLLKFSAMEIYNEAVRDLLSPDATQLRLLDDPEKGTVVEKLTEETLRDKGHLLELLAVCEAQRQIGETALNETSSRSHQILRLTIESSAKQFMGRGNSSTLMACVNFVDLAGSERASQTQSAGMRLKEGSHINRSLLTLGKVIRQLRVASDGNISDHTTRRWDEHNRSPDSLPRNVSEDLLSSSDTCEAIYEDQDDIGSKALDASHVCNDHHHDPEIPKGTSETHQQAMDEHSVPNLHQPRGHTSADSIEIYQANIMPSSELTEEHCKEVQYIETNKLRRSQAFLPADHDGTNIDEGKHGESMIDTTDSAIKLYTCDSDPSSDTEKPNNDESLALKRCVISSRDSVLTRSKSCRASFMVIPNSWFDDRSMDMKITTPGDIFKYAPIRPEKVRRSLYPENGDFRCDLSSDCSKASGRVTSDTVVDKNTCDDEEEGSINDLSCIPEVKEKIEECRTSQLEGNQYTITEDLSEMKNAEDVISAISVDSPSRWPINFEKKQKEIIELWHECNVSIVHRTYFFLLFKVDNADSIYLEVEHRRLSFIKGSFKAGFEASATITSSLRNLRHERDMLYRQMLKKLHLVERESLYTKWGIDLNSKQRRLQLSRRIWTQTDMEHVRESAGLVAKLVEHLEKGQVIKEMFGLSFTLNPRSDRRSFGWVGARS
ncbi:kinesin-like protein KIN-7J isoform X3 [Panicum virgatum]|uniref:kinesin-like protein KIN-7J isoform X3 n=1 Tax=Panicum virgatum TaxID=38727 RepID=UPI0019D53759|nr:kinesin-like protein KIN-7J isoform X3 [Panicum virgatum]